MIFSVNGDNRAFPRKKVVYLAVFTQKLTEGTHFGIETPRKIIAYRALDGKRQFFFAEKEVFAAESGSFPVKFRNKNGEKSETRIGGEKFCPHKDIIPYPKDNFGFFCDIVLQNFSFMLK